MQKSDGTVLKELNSKISQIVHVEALIDDIEVSNRFRQDYGDIEALAASMTRDGLIHPIAVCLNSSKEPGAKQFRLLAGGRRHKAITELAKQKGLERVTCRLYDKELSELEIRVIEFAENLYRKELTWQEKDKLKRRILMLQQKIHGKKTSTAPDAPGFSMSDMAKMTGKSKGSLSDSIQLAKMMEDTPEINWNQFETRSDAMKAIKGAKKKVKQTKDAKEAVKVIGEGESKKKTLINCYHVEDFFKGAEKIGDATMDFIEIDPPYSIALEKMKKGYDYEGYNEIHPEKYPDFMTKVFQESYRVLKPNSWLICWFGPEPWFEDIYMWLNSAQFKTTRMCGIWTKGQGQSLNPDRSLANSYEMFFYARKGSPLLNRPGSTNTFDYKPIAPQLKMHPTERPIEMMRDILTTFTGPGSRVLVPFAGSGNTGVAAAHELMIPVMFDLTDEFKESYTIKIHKMEE